MTASLLSVAASVCALPDPTIVAQRLGSLPVGQLAASGHQAGAIAVALFQASHAAQDAAGTTAAAWSTGNTAVAAVGQTGMAGMSGRSVMTTIAGAIDGAQATMHQIQSLARAAVEDAETALRQAGVDPTTGRVPAAPIGLLPFPLSSPGGTTVDRSSEMLGPIVSAACDRLAGLESRLEACLTELALALRTDPRDLMQRLPAVPWVPPAPPPALTDVAGSSAAALGDAMAVTVGAFGAAVGGLLAGGDPTVAGRTGHAVADAVRSAAAAVTDRVTGITHDLTAPLTPVPTTAAEANDEARGRLTVDLGSADEVTRVRAANIQAALDEASTSGRPVQLLLYTPATATSQGTAAIGIGDLGTADSVTTMVPGIQNSADGMSGALSDAVRLQSEAHRRAPGDTMAVVAWLGYDIPFTSGYTPDWSANLAAATDDRAAVAGAAALKEDLARFRAFAPDTARQVVIGHSMGSVVVSAAAAQGAEIDNAVLLASPGASRQVESVHDYANVPDGGTYVMALDDPVTRVETDIGAAYVDALAKSARFNPLDVWSYDDAISDFQQDPPGSQFGPDPADADFGAVTVDAVGGQRQYHLTDALAPVNDQLGLTGSVLQLAVGEADDLLNHSQNIYLGGDALSAVADIAVGNLATVPTRPGR